MTSRILGKLDLDDTRLAPEVAAIRDLPKGEEVYDEFTSGFWKNVPLWNDTGDGSDTLFRESESPARPTEHATRLPYLNEVIASTFAVDRLGMVRGRDIVDASMMPHKDFLELDESGGGPHQQNFRVLVVLEDNEHTYNSDEEQVFRMRRGEIWFLDAAGVHCAANFSDDSRISLCLDFSFDRPFTAADIFADRSAYTPGIEPLLVKRSPLPKDFALDVRRLSVACNRHTFRDLAFALAKLHFTVETPSIACYDWLIEITERTDDPALVAKAEEAKEFYVTDRAMHQRFSFTSW